MAVAACVVAGGAALVRLDSAPRQAILSAAACTSLATAAIISTSRLATIDPAMTAVFLLLGAVALSMSTPIVVADDGRRLLVIVAAATLLGPVWAVWDDERDLALPAALRLSAAALALSGAWDWHRDRHYVAANLGVAAAALAGPAEIDPWPLEMILIASVGIVLMDRWWREQRTIPADWVSDNHRTWRRYRPHAVAFATLLAVGWLCAVIGSWDALVVVSTGLIAVTTCAVGRWTHSTRQLERQVRSLQRVSREIARRSQIDGLTKLPNREAFERRLSEEAERAVRHQQPVSLCFIDIDHFKAVNDTYGHGFGDGVLAEVAQSLRATSRTIDIVSRYGGEEFVVIAPGTWSCDAVVLAERLRTCVSTLRSASLEQPVTISVGVAGLPEHAADAESLLRRADEALYEAKRAGRDRTRVACPTEATGRG